MLSAESYYSDGRNVLIKITTRHAFIGRLINRALWVEQPKQIDLDKVVTNHTIYLCT
jgi:hypothetical protein